MADKIHASSEWLDQCSTQLGSVTQAIQSAAGVLAGIHLRRDEGGDLRTSMTVRLAISGQSFSGSNAAEDIRQLSSAARSLTQSAGRMRDGARAAARVFERVENGAVSILREIDPARANDNLEGIGVGAAVAGAAAASVVSEDTDKEKREEQAKWFKIGVGVLCTVASVAVVIATGGAALPVIAAGVATGAVAAGSFNAADQYAEKGWEDIDWSEAGQHAVIGGIVGGVTSALSIGGSAAGQQIVNHFATTATTASGRLIAHTAGGAITSVATGMVARGGGDAVSQYLSNGEVDWNRVRDQAFDPTRIVMDGAIGGTTGYMQGRKYNEAIAIHEKNGQTLRSESYRNNNPYSKGYGDTDWSQAPNSGIDSNYPVDGNYEIPEGTVLRRSGSENGGFLRNASDSYESASLPYEYNPAVEHEYVVTRPIPGTTKSTAAPAFDQPGGATQYQLPNGMSIQDLLNSDPSFLDKLY